MCNSSISSSVRPLDPVKPVDISSVIPGGSSRATSNSTSTTASGSTSTSTTKSGSFTVTASGSVSGKPGETPEYKASVGTSYERGSSKTSVVIDVSSKGGASIGASYVKKF